MIFVLFIFEDRILINLSWTGLLKMSNVFQIYHSESTSTSTSLLRPSGGTPFLESRAPPLDAMINGKCCSRRCWEQHKIRGPGGAPSSPLSRRPQSSVKVLSGRQSKTTIYFWGFKMPVQYNLKCEGTYTSNLGLFNLKVAYLDTNSAFENYRAEKKSLCVCGCEK